MICGSKIDNYLLEKSRVTGPSALERNFHVFYLLLSGTTPAERAALHLTRALDYHYLTAGGVVEDRDAGGSTMRDRSSRRAMEDEGGAVEDTDGGGASLLLRGRRRQRRRRRRRREGVVNRKLVSVYPVPSVESDGISLMDVVDIGESLTTTALLFSVSLLSYSQRKCRLRSDMLT
jgi:hypothetical protein